MIATLFNLTCGLLFGFAQSNLHKLFLVELSRPSSGNNSLDVEFEERLKAVKRYSCNYFHPPFGHPLDFWYFGYKIVLLLVAFQAIGLDPRKQELFISEMCLLQLLFI